MATDLGVYGTARPPTVRVRRTRRPRARPLLAAALVVVLGADAAAVVVHGRRDAGADPAAAVLTLFAAADRDDGPAVQRTVAGAGLLTTADLRGQVPGHDPTVLAVRRSGATATVTVRYLLGLTPSVSTLQLVEVGTGRLTAPHWRVVGGLPVLRITAPPWEPAALVDGRRVPLVHGVAGVTVFPGYVPVGLPAFAAAGAVDPVLVRTGGAAVALTPPVGDAVDEQLVALLGLRSGVDPDDLTATDDSAVAIEDDGWTLQFALTVERYSPPTGPWRREYPIPVALCLGTARYDGTAVSLTTLTLVPR